LYACTCSSLHSLQNNTSKLWFSTLCNHSWKGTSFPQNSAYVMECVVMSSLWPGYPIVFCCSSHTISMAEMYTNITLTCAPFMYVKDISNHTFHASNTTTELYLHGEMTSHSFAYYTSTYLYNVLNWLWVVSN
jgi:hypothetical protein